MKLAILGTRGIPARYGGFETFAEQLANRLASFGIDVTVFCPSDSPKDDITYRGVTLTYVRSISAGKFSEMFWDIWCFWKARRGFDVVYMLGVGAGFAAWIPRAFGSQVWINSDGLEWKRSKWTLPQRLYLAFAEALSVMFASRMIADSAAIADYLRKRYPVLRRVSTIAYGADIPAETPGEGLLCEWDVQPDGYYLVVCRLEPENHVIEIIKGLEQSDSRLPLIILGNIDAPNKYVQSILTSHSNRVRFIGTVYDVNKLAALRFFARAYIHGHSVGGTNPSLLEGMACSNLVIAHDNPFNREVLADSGLYFTRPEELASLVNAVDGNHVDAKVKRLKAVTIIRDRYLWDQIAEAYLQLLNGVAQPGATYAGYGVKAG